jgi:hypothetical protein
MNVVVNINACNSNCTAMYSKPKKGEIGLQMDTRPICVKVGDYVTISTLSKFDTGIHILGRGQILRGNSSNKI